MLKEKVNQALHTLLKELGDVPMASTINETFSISETIEMFKEPSTVFGQALEGASGELSIPSIRDKIGALRRALKDQPPAKKPKKIGLITPDYEQATHIIRQWALPIRESILARKMELIWLDKELATRANFEAMAPTVDTVFHFGHGNWTAIAGHDNEIILDLKNVKVLNKKSMVSLSCMSSRILGMKCALAGAKYYYGYKRMFIFMTPPYDRYFKEAATIPFHWLLDGHRVETTYIRQKLEFNEQILRSLASPIGIISSIFLLWDEAGLEPRNPF